MPSCLKRGWSCGHTESESPRSKLCKFSGGSFNSGTQSHGKLNPQRSDHISGIQVINQIRAKRKFDEYSLEEGNFSHCAIESRSSYLENHNKSIPQNCQPRLQEHLGDSSLTPLEQFYKRRKMSPRPDSVTSMFHTNDMAEVDASFNAFNYWKPTLPDIDEDLMRVLGENSSGCQRMESTSGPEEKGEFNSFNFWRTPVADFDIDMEINSL